MAATQQLQKTPNFRSRDFLLDHIESIYKFYHPRCLDDTTGGFLQEWADDGPTVNKSWRHVAFSCRMVVNYAQHFLHFTNNKDEDTKYIKHGLKYILDSHCNKETGEFPWELRDGKVTDPNTRAYGLAFVALAAALSFRAGVEESKQLLESTWNTLETHFFSEEYGLYADEATPGWKEILPYRGQNANMHITECMLAAFEATHEKRYLDRSYSVTSRMMKLAEKTPKGLIWEHYTPKWEIDWEYNKDQAFNIFKPWGYQVGHQAEWAKLLIILYRARPEAWMLEKARLLFLAAMEGWDSENGGLVYGIGLKDEFCNASKLFWVQAESLAAAAMLGHATQEDIYWDWYDRIWKYVWAHFVDHQYGGWYSFLSRENVRVEPLKSPFGFKCDYHSMGACFDSLSAIPE